MKILGLVFAGIIITLMVMYSTAIYGATDEGVDLTGTDYEDQYDSQTDMMLINNSMTGVLPVIFGAIIVIASIVVLKKATH